jgi:hypothetical protein
LRQRRSACKYQIPYYLFACGEGRLKTAVSQWLRSRLRAKASS